MQSLTLKNVSFARTLVVLWVVGAASCAQSKGEAVIFAPIESEVQVVVDKTRRVMIERRAFRRFSLPRGSHEFVIKRLKDSKELTLEVDIDHSSVIVPAAAEQCFILLERPKPDDDAGRRRPQRLLPLIVERYRANKPLTQPPVALEDLAVVPCDALALHSFAILQTLGYKVPRTAAGMKVRFCGQSISTTRTKVECSDPSTRDITPLAKLAELRKLDLSGTAVRAIAPLAKLQKLEELSLEDTGVTDLNALQSLAQLHTLNLNGTAVRDLAPLARLTKLKRLDLRETKVRDVPSIAALEVLDLSHSGVKDLGPARALVRLERLILNRTRVSDLKALSALTRLRELDLRHTRVRDLGPLRALTRLEDLLLSGTSVSELSPLRRLRNLQTLYLNDTRVRNIRPLKRLVAMKVLNLAGTRVVQLQPLSQMTELSVLYLAGTPIRDISPLRKLALFRLGLSRTSVTDLGPLLDHDGLGTLSVVGLRISPAQLHALRARNPDLQLIRTQAQLDRENTTN